MFGCLNLFNFFESISIFWNFWNSNIRKVSWLSFVRGGVFRIVYVGNIVYCMTHPSNRQNLGFLVWVRCRTIGPWRICSPDSIRSRNLIIWRLVTTTNISENRGRCIFFEHSFETRKVLRSDRTPFGGPRTEVMDVFSIPLFLFLFTKKLKFVEYSCRSSSQHLKKKINTPAHTNSVSNPSFMFAWSWVSPVTCSSITDISVRFFFLFSFRCTCFLLLNVFSSLFFLQNPTDARGCIIKYTLVTFLKAEEWSDKDKA